MEVDWLGGLGQTFGNRRFCRSNQDEEASEDKLDRRAMENLCLLIMKNSKVYFQVREKRLISSIEEVNSRLDVDLNGNIFTVYSMFNVNIMGEFELESLWRSMRMDQPRARSAAAEILRKRNEQRLNEIGGER